MVLILTTYPTTSASIDNSHSTTLEQGWEEAPDAARHDGACAEEEPENVLQKNTAYLGGGMILLTLSGNIALIFTLNYLYILLYSSQTVSYLIKQSLQMTLALIKVLWNALIKYIITVSAVPLLDKTALNTSSRRVILLACLIFFNNILAPCITCALTDSDCFLNAFVRQGSIQTSFTVQGYCWSWILNSKDKIACYAGTEQTFYTSVDPPFVYNYQCTSAVIRAYIPIYFYLALLAGVVRPCVFLCLSRWEISALLLRLLLAVGVPNVLWPHNATATGQRLLGAQSILVYQFTHLGTILIFGFLYPPLSIALIVAMIFETTFWHYTIREYIRTVRDPARLTELDSTCADLMMCDQQCKQALLWIWAPICGLTTYDMAAASLGSVVNGLEFIIVPGLLAIGSIICSCGCFKRFARFARFAPAVASASPGRSKASIELGNGTYHIVHTEELRKLHEENDSVRVR
jgi:hypothetical protein